MKKLFCITITFIISLQFCLASSQERDSSTLAKEYLNKAQIYSQQSYYDSAAYYYKKAVIYYNIPSNQASCYHNIGLNYMYTNNFDSSHFYINKALTMRINFLSTDDPLIADTYTALGSLYSFIKRDYTKGIKYLNKALSLLKKGNNTNTIYYAHVMNNLGNIYSDLGDIERSIKYYEQSLIIKEKKSGSKSKAIMRTYYNLASSYLFIDDFENALKYIEKTYAICKEILPPGNEFYGLCLFAFASVYSSTGEYKRALMTYNEALPILINTHGETNPFVGDTYMGIADCYALLGDFENAFIYFKKAEDIYINAYGNKHPYLSELYKFWGMAFLEKGDFTKALKKYQQGIIALAHEFQDTTLSNGPSFENCIDKLAYLAILKAKGEAFEKKHNQLRTEISDLVSSLFHYEQAISLIDNIRSNFRADASTQLLLSKEREVYEGAIRICFNLWKVTNSKKYILKAFQFSEKSKSLLLLQEFKKAQVEKISGIPSSILLKEQSITDSLTFIDKKIFELYETQISPASHLTEKLKSKRLGYQFEHEKLLQEIEKTYPSYFSLRHDLTPVSMSEVEDRLRKDSMVLIEFFVGKDHTYVFLISSKSITLFQIKVSQEIEKWVNEFHIGINNNRLSIYQEAANKIYETLISPLGAIPKHLIIIPDLELGYIPFDALLTRVVHPNKPFKEYPFMIKSHEIQYCYSASLWIEMESKQNNNNRTLGFAPSFVPCDSLNKINKDEMICPLYFNEKEVMNIKKLFPGKYYIGEEGSLSNFLNQPVSFNIIHLSTHANLNNDNSDYSYLAFSNQKDSSSYKLYIKDLYNAQRPVEMVVLSACDTGIGQLKKGEGIISLARGFSYAGANSIITSLWKVEDQSTSEIITSFYKNLKAGQSKSAALRNAKLDYIDSAKEFAHPFYWAALIPIGDMAPLNSDGSNNWLWLLLGSIILITIVVQIINNKGNKKKLVIK